MMICSRCLPRTPRCFSVLVCTNFIISQLIIKVMAMTSVHGYLGVHQIQSIQWRCEGMPQNTKNVNLEVLEEDLDDHQSHQDSFSGNH